MTENLTEEFVAKVDAFAASLEVEEQAMLIGLLTESDDEVVGFGGGGPWGGPDVRWPGLVSLGIGNVAPSTGADAASLLSDASIGNGVTGSTGGSGI